MRGVELRAAQQFNQGGDHFTPGQVIPDDTWRDAWASDTLANRLANGFVKWEPITEEGDEEGAPDPRNMTKQQLLTYVEETFKVKLDQRMNRENMLQQVAVLQERARAVAAASAARDAQVGGSGSGTGDSGNTPPS